MAESHGQGAAAAQRRVLYVAYWGLLEPLGQSLIAPAVLGLAARGFHVHLITFDKPCDLQDSVALRRTRARLGIAGVEWTPLRYHKRPRPLAKLLDLAIGLAAALRLARRGRPDLVHARTFVGGLIGRMAALLLRRPWIYHGEGFWPEQQVEGGYWMHGSLAHRVTRRVDRWLHEQAAAIILLSHRARPVVEAYPGVARRRPPIAIVPSCVDLEHFRPSAARPERPLRIVYVGSLGGRYLIEPMVRFFQALRKKEPTAGLLLYSHSDSREVGALLASLLPPASWELRRVDHAEMPAVLSRCHAGLHFLAAGPGAESCSPTKIGEYWACGLPVITSAGAGDIDRIVGARRVGVVVSSLEPTDLEQAAERLLELLEQPDLPARCRLAAEEEYALEQALAVQQRLYRRLLSGQVGIG